MIDRCALLLLLLGACSDRASPGDIQISEIVTSGLGCDDQPTCTDWIELENVSARELDFEGLWISDSSKNPLRHQLADRAPIKVAPRGVLVVYADGRTDLGPFHLPFKLSKDGEPVVVSSRNGALIDSVVAPPMRTGQSYARVAGALLVCDTPTPSAANACK